jgi:hypothetical protein
MDPFAIAEQFPVLSRGGSCRNKAGEPDQWDAHAPPVGKIHAKLVITDLNVPGEWTILSGQRTHSSSAVQTMSIDPRERIGSAGAAP